MIVDLCNRVSLRCKLSLVMRFGGWLNGGSSLHMRLQEQSVADHIRVNYAQLLLAFKARGQNHCTCVQYLH